MSYDFFKQRTLGTGQGDRTLTGDWGGSRQANLLSAPMRPVYIVYWSKVRDSNTPPPGPKPGALPDELTLDLWFLQLDSNQPPRG